MLSINGLDVCHGYVRAVRGLSLEVKEGELLAILGPNGAGKSTLLGTLAGLYKPMAGEILLRGKNVVGLSPEQMVRQGISLVPEKREIFASLSVMDNLLLGAFHRRSNRRELKQAEQLQQKGQLRHEEMFEAKEKLKHKDQIINEAREILNIFPALQGREDDPAGSLSGGLQQMLAIGRALMSQPELLLLDEPSVGLAPLVVREIMSTMADLKKTGVTIVLVEQNTKAALKVADRAVLMERGTIHGTGGMGPGAQHPVSDTAVRQAYLGKTRVCGAEAL